jgi:hypothetical protein
MTEDNTTKPTSQDTELEWHLTDKEIEYMDRLSAVKCRSCGESNHEILYWSTDLIGPAALKCRNCGSC